MNKTRSTLLCVALVVSLAGPAAAGGAVGERPQESSTTASPTLASGPKPPLAAHPVEETSAGPWSGPAQDEIDAILAATPGARQISQYKVEIQEGVVIGVPAPATPDAAVQAAGDPTIQNHPDSDCWSGWVCFFEHAGYQGHMLELFSCNTVELINIPMDALQNWQNKISSWIDVQTGGAFARLYFFDRLTATTQAPRAEDFAGAANDFSTHIDPC